MATKTKPSNTRSLGEIDISKITVVKDHNPRTEFDAEAHKALTESIEQFGVITPVLVSGDGATGYNLVAGERRLRAAKAAGLKTVPAQIDADAAAAQTLALIENVQRADLNPVEEARAFAAIRDAHKLTQKDLAKRVGVSEGQISERLAMLELPDAALDYIAAGDLAAAAARPLTKLAKVSPDAAAHVAHLIANDPDYDGSQLARELPAVLTHLRGRVGQQIDELPQLEAAISNRQSTVDLSFDYQETINFNWTDDLAELHAQLSEQSEKHYKRPRLSDERFEAGVKFGSVFAFKADGNTHYFTTDKEWLTQQLIEIAAENQQRIEQAAADRAASRAQAGGGATAEMSEEDAKEERRKQRAKDLADREKARGNNLDFGTNLLKKFGATKITPARMRALALEFIAQNTDLAGAGLALVDDRIQTVETKEQRNGSVKTKVTYPTNAEAHEILVERVTRAKTVEEIFGLVWSALMAAQYAAKNATPQSDIRGWNSRHLKTRGNPSYYGGFTAESVTLETDAVSALAREVGDPIKAAALKAKEAEAAEKAKKSTAKKQG